MRAYEELLYDVAAGVLTITLNRPDALNALTPTMCVELVDALGRAGEDDDVRVVLVTGAGRAFCAGADLSSGGGTFDYAKRGQVEEAGRDGGGLISLAVYECPKPVIAVINGPAVGVGITMTLPMDLRIAADTAKFGFVFTRRGIVPEAASSWFLPRVVGISQAAEWFYSGRVFRADEALAGGLVRSVHPSEDLMGAAMAVAREIADNTSAISVALARQMMWRGLTYPTPYQSHIVDSRAIWLTGKTPDAIEGVTSFLDKRPPAFTGKVSSDLPAAFDPPFPSWAAGLPHGEPWSSASPGVDPAGDDKGVLRFTIDVDGERFAAYQYAPGGWNYEWLTGPNPGYGFGWSGPPAQNEDDHRETLRSFLRGIDPRTGYLADDDAAS
ncbi:MAG: crotonase/enoyl-CoA hydratase family protein [Frankiaceae bacterium]|nr:crotonase/enoyl-CoA hydratase family protein [Frankiaceae bacterium]